MANRKFRHNVNEARVITSSNSDLNGDESYFKFKIETSTGDGESDGKLFLENMFATSQELNENPKQFNIGIKHYDGTEFYFNHNNERISSINEAFAPETNDNRIRISLDAVITDGEVETSWSEEDVEVTIKGQFGQLNLWAGSDNTNLPSSDHLVFGDDDRQDEGIILEEYALTITQWGNYNMITDMNQWCENVHSELVIEATDEPRFKKGASLYKLGLNSNDLFTPEALETIKNWDFNTIGAVGRMLENHPTLDLSGVSLSGSNENNGMAYYMRSRNPHLDKGASIRTTNIKGWAGYNSLSLSDTLQGSNKVHDWSKLKTGKVTDFSYFAWNNTKDSGFNYKNFDTFNGVDFTGMFGHASNTDVDPSEWDMSSAETLFFMIGMDTTGSTWNGQLNWKTMKKVNDIHSVVKNRGSYTGARLNEFAPYSGNVVLFRSAFSNTAINYDFSNWDFSGVDARRTDIQFNENNSGGIMGNFVKDCPNMSFTNLVKLLEACDRPFGQGGLPVNGVDPEIGTVFPNPFEFGNTYGDSLLFGFYASEINNDPTLVDRGHDAYDSLKSKGYTMGGLQTLFP